MFRIDLYEEQIPETMIDKLHAFEKQFRYPLNDKTHFTIKHPHPYNRFTQAIGKSVHFIAHTDNYILGVLSIAIRELRFNTETIRSAYICDLKIDPNNTQLYLLPRLFKQAQDYTMSQCASAYGIVMHGSKRNPEHYTGRLGIAAFSKHSAIEIHSLPASTSPQTNAVCMTPLDESPFKELQSNTLTHDHILSISADIGTRSTITPQLLYIDDENFAVFEDTRAAKQLFLIDGREIRNAHLSHLHCTHTEKAELLLHTAQAYAADQQFERLFFCLNSKQNHYLSADMRKNTQISHAHVYAYNMPDFGPLHIHSSEI